MSFSTTPIVVPELWKRDWASAVEEFSGTEQELVRSQRYLVQTLSRARSLPSSPELIGWLTLWSRLFNGCESSRTSLDRGASYSLLVLNRVVLELDIHLAVIADLSGHANPPRQSDFSSEAVISRLRAYAALCLWQDREHYSQMLQPGVLEQMYDPGPSRRLAAQLGERQDAWAAMMGEIEVLSDQEAEFDLRRARDQAERMVAFYDQCLADDRLHSWVAVLRERPRTTTLHGLLNVQERTVRDRLRAMGLGFAYSEYGGSSRLLHGTTIDYLALNTGPVFMPLFADAFNDFDHHLVKISQQLRSGALLLHLIQSRAFGESLAPLLG